MVMINYKLINNEFLINCAKLNRLKLFNRRTKRSLIGHCSTD